MDSGMENKINYIIIFKEMKYENKKKLPRLTQPG